MSASVKITPLVKWDDEGAWLKFANLPYEASEEIASGFIVDASVDKRVIGLEILWPEARRAGCPAAPALACGIFCAALAGLSWQYDACAAHPKRNIVADIRRRLDGMIDAAGLDLQTRQDLTVGDTNQALRLDLAILDNAGVPLLCAEIRRGQFQRDIVQRDNDLLRNAALPAYPAAVGIGVFIDETGLGYRNHPVEPGVWSDWQDAVIPGGKVWAHLSIIPPAGRNYNWLPEELRDPMWQADGPVCKLSRTEG